MKLLIDMNLSPAWVPMLKELGWESVHWMEIGSYDAPDREILDWTRDNEYVLFTHDLDFGAILAASQATCPSVIQIRTQDVNPYHIRGLVSEVLNKFQDHLEKGALISFNENKSRASILPLVR